MTIFSSHEALHLIERYGPGLVGLLAALEATGVPLPAESILVAAAVYAGTTGKLSILAVVAAAAAGAIVGDNLGYLIGRTLGYRALHRWGRYLGVTGARLTLGRYLFRRHGAKVVFAGRFVALLRTFVSLLAGANRMEWPRFLASNAAGGTVWACAYGFGAYALGNEVKRISGPAATALGIAAGIAVAIGIFYLRRHESELIAQAQRAMAED